MKVKLYCEIYTIILYQYNFIFITIIQYISIILRKSQFENASPKTLINKGFRGTIKIFRKLTYFSSFSHNVFLPLIPNNIRAIFTISLIIIFSSN